jgi:4-amino-4-deoxy-L-arabinose transferase-like glycosyltransferase
LRDDPARDKRAPLMRWLSRSTAFPLATMALALSAVWSRPGPTLLIGGDAGCYARVARELSSRPGSDWLELTLGGQPFYEHPPLGLWVEGLVVTVMGPRPEPLVWLARLYASGTVVMLWLTARRLLAKRGADGSNAGFVVLGALTLPGFLYQSQVAMLEAPLTLCLSVGLWALAGLMGAPSRGAVLVFAVAVTAGFWVKGPPAFVLVGVLGVLAGLRWVPWRWALVVTVSSLVVVWLSATAFDAIRGSRGLDPFFSTWWAKQVVASVTSGRHNPDRDPFFYVGPTLRWYGPAVAALAIGLVARLRGAARLAPTILLLGATLWLGVIVGFSLPVQKYQWYLHPGAAGAALVVGAALMLIPQRLMTPLTGLALVGALVWPLIRLVPWDERLSSTQRSTAALQRASGPEAGDAIADCSSMDPWVSGHLMGFLFRAERVDCDIRPARFRFDGEQLTRQRE